MSRKKSEEVKLKVEAEKEEIPADFELLEEPDES
jgi:hypothetical protein